MEFIAEFSRKQKPNVEVKFPRPSCEIRGWFRNFLCVLNFLLNPDYVTCVCEQIFHAFYLELRDFADLKTEFYYTSRIS